MNTQLSNTDLVSVFFYWSRDRSGFGQSLASRASPSHRSNECHPERRRSRSRTFGSETEANARKRCVASGYSQRVRTCVLRNVAFYEAFVTRNVRLRKAVHLIKQSSLRAFRRLVLLRLACAHIRRTSASLRMTALTEPPSAGRLKGDAAYTDSSSCDFFAFLDLIFFLILIYKKIAPTDTPANITI